MVAAEVLARIQEALEWAADVLKPFESGSARLRLKGGDELVTAADHAVNRVLHGILWRKGEGWLSKGSADDGPRLNNDRVWMVDPIGGRREFIAGVPEYCVSIAFVEQGVAVAGGILNPATHETFLGGAGAGVTYLGEDVPAASGAGLAGATVLASRQEVMRGEWEAFRKSGFAIRPLGSVACRLARVAAGLADATWTLTPKHQWEVAAGVALVEASGGFVSTLDFRRPVFNRDNALLRGLVASRRNLEGEIVKLLRPRIAPDIATPASAASPGAQAFEETVRTVIQECLSAGRRPRQG